MSPVSSIPQSPFQHTYREERGFTSLSAIQRYIEADAEAQKRVVDLV